MAVEHLSADSVQELLKAGRDRLIGKRFRHYKKGTTYTVTELAVNESAFHLLGSGGLPLSGEPGVSADRVSSVLLVVYLDEKTGARWARPLDVFFAVVGVDADFRPLLRFTEVPHV